jgi:hypothetical protein
MGFISDGAWRSIRPADILRITNHFADESHSLAIMGREWNCQPDIPGKKGKQKWTSEG